MTSGNRERRVAVLDWLRGYDRSWLRRDVIAGVTVAALVVPKALGYAGIVGVPVEYGLYAAASGALIYPVFGSSRQISTNPSSALAAVAASAVVLIGLTGTGALPLVAWITLITGLLFVLLALLRMGWISQFLSRAVVKGFLFGAAIEVVVGELPKLTGTSAEGTNAWREFGSWVRSLEASDPTTLALAGISILVMLGMRMGAKRVPGALMLVSLGILSTWALDLEVALVGQVPRGLPRLVLPDLDYLLANAQVIFPASVGILLIGFSQSAGDAREFAARHRYKVDIDRESVAQGLANVGSALVQGIPVSTSLSASSLNDQSGAKSQMSSLVTGLLVLLTLILLAPLFSYLPTAVLSVVIIDAVVFGMMDVAALRRFFGVSRSDFWIAMAAIAGVLSAGVLAGVMIGIFLSLIWLIRESTHPAIFELGNQPGTRLYRDLEGNPQDVTHPGLLILRFDAGLFFANADALSDRLQAIVLSRDPPVRSVILSCEGINFIDAQGAEKLKELTEVVTQSGLTLSLSRCKPEVRDVLEKDGFIELLGSDRMFATTPDAVAAALEQIRAPHGGSDRR